jgi:beta-galactosidase
VCAEWELGGYPSWLLKDRATVLRSDEPTYTTAVHAWFTRLGQEIKPLLLKNGGPIIAVQLENEYGSFGDDKKYLEGLKHELIASGMGDSLIYTADGPKQVPKGSLPELPAVINFGTGEAEKGFAILAAERPDGPRMSGEYWAGWFDHWGDKHHVTDGDKEAAELRWMLDQGYSVSLYMFHGGTSFGWMNGANSNGKNYEPDTTSYDYDAPLDEKGEPRAKFYAFKKVIADVTKTQPPSLPTPQARSVFRMEPRVLTASLWRNLPVPTRSKTLLMFEDLDQAYGYMLYRTRIDAGAGGPLMLEGLHDYAQVYVDQKLVGTLDRRLNEITLDVPRVDHAATLDILVENSGRVNYTVVLRGERKGITGPITLDDKAPQRWEIYSLPMDKLNAIHFEKATCSGPCFYRTSMDVTTPEDTYIDTRGLHKGMVWLGDKPLGRFWSIGPQYALYTPAPWLHAGSNEVTFFDLSGSGEEHLNTVDEPIFTGSIGTQD